MKNLIKKNKNIMNKNQINNHKKKMKLIYKRDNFKNNFQLCVNKINNNSKILCKEIVNNSNNLIYLLQKIRHLSNNSSNNSIKKIIDLYHQIKIMTIKKQNSIKLKLKDWEHIRISKKFWNKN